MNNYCCYSIYDKVAEQYSAPFLSINDATATREFNQRIAVNPLAEPTDFELYSVGIFSTDSGQFVPSSPLRFICKGKVISNGKK